MTDRCLWVEEDVPLFRPAIDGLNCFGDSLLTCFLYIETILSHDEPPTVLIATLVLNLASQTIYNLQVGQLLLSFSSDNAAYLP